MNELYEYLKEKRYEMYQSNKGSVEIDKMRFFQLFRVICDMQHIRNIVYDEQDMVEALKRIREGR